MVYNMYRKLALSICVFLICINFTYADSRYCGEPERNSTGNIIRSKAVIAEFIKLYPLPAGFRRSDYQINHAIPLVCGGCDSVENMIWMHIRAKTCAEDYCQDRIEQLVMCPKNWRK